VSDLPETANKDPFVAEFLASLELESASPYTLRNYRQALEEFIAWKTKETGAPPHWPALARDDFRYYLRFLGRTNRGRSALSLRFSALRSFYKFLIRKGVVTESPIKNIALPKREKKLPRFLGVDQMHALLQAPTRLAEAFARAGKKAKVVQCLRDQAILELFYSSGIRISELCSLRANQLDMAERSLRVFGKGKKERLLPLGSHAQGAIQNYWASLKVPPALHEPIFFLSEKKRAPLSPRVVQLWLKKYLAVAGLDPQLTPHKIRHTYATHLLDAGADLRSVQELLGHAHVITTQVYTHVTTERLKKVYDSAHPRA